jgi:hypothetical protein
MQLVLSEDLIKAMKDAGCKNHLLTDRDWGDRTFDSSKLSKEDIALIHKCNTGALLEDIKNRRVLSRLKVLDQMAARGHAGVKIKKLEALAEAMTVVINALPHRWVFIEEPKFDVLLPYFVESVVYVPPNGRQRTQASVRMTLKAIDRGHETEETVHFNRTDIIGGKTVLEILDESDVIIETKELVNDYNKEYKIYQSYMNLTGEQFIGRGKAERTEQESDDDSDISYRRWRTTSSTSLEKDGNAAKLVMDDGYKRGSKLSFTDAVKLDHNENDDFDYDDNEDDVGEDDIAEDAEVDTEAPKTKEYKLPMHPILRMFNLENHSFVRVHVTSIEPYKYKPEIGNKLVLPQEHRDLVNALTLSAAEKLDDIVAGKAQGVIILCSGQPGTGKTLTAEVYSEIAKRPLYMVQCSQLGTDEETLEKNLSVVLARTARWKAILLIDESDVYIHERGKDIHQNAIVGTFLRVLEYFKGILFFTTNRATIIDDAIISRCTAHVKYDIPRETARNQIWRILADKFEVPLTDDQIAAAIIVWPNISGRSIRQLLRLAKFMASYHKTKVDLSMLQRAAKFHDFTDDELTKAADKGRTLLDDVE